MSVLFFITVYGDIRMSNINEVLLSFFERTDDLAVSFDVSVKSVASSSPCLNNSSLSYFSSIFFFIP